MALNYALQVPTRSMRAEFRVETVEERCNTSSQQQPSKSKVQTEARSRSTADDDNLMSFADDQGLGRPWRFSVCLYRVIGR